jgi:murein DD-endopeptidase MepM/ murein hydrolase activator NlpD
MPDDVPALAASSGTVRYARRTPRGYTVVIDHAAGWSTYYTHLSTLLVKPGQLVAVGEPLGLIGGDPSKPPHLRHLHFALWRGEWQDRAVNPAPLMASWDVLAAPVAAPARIAA